MTLLVDSHCHLDFPEFADELDQVVTRARAAGVGLMVTISTSFAGFPKVRAVAERFPEVWCSVGVHPHEAAEDWGLDAERLIEAARHPKVVGIGETGLDFYYDHSPRDRQAASFRAHIAAARTTGLPLIVHTRDADRETIEILAEETGKGAFPGLIHCFSGTDYLADEAVKLGLYVSLSGIVTFKKAEAVRAAARRVPLDRLLVETDAPYLAPVPKRGARNEPAFVAHTAAAVAGLYGVGISEIASTTSANFFCLFKKVTPPQAFAACA